MQMTPYQLKLRLRPRARLLIRLATLIAMYTPFKIPHRYVNAVTNRSWQTRIGVSPWFDIRIDANGKAVAA